MHTRLVLYAADQLQGVLPGNLRARVEERVVLETGDDARSIYPDVRIAADRKKRPKQTNGGVALATTIPMIVEILDEPQTQRFIEIRDPVPGGKLVTVIEVLSPSNKKAGDGRDQYLAKQRELLQGGVSLVEIDLIHGGDWMLAIPEWVAQKWPSLYRVAVRRGWDGTRAEYYPITLDEKLPTIAIPLRKTDADVPLDLQALIELCYRNGGYEDIDYRRSPKSPLPRREARWAGELLRQKGLRSSRKPKSR